MTNLEIQNAYMGSGQVDKIYLGSEVVWSNGPGPDPYLSMPLTFEITSPGNIVWKARNTAYTCTIEYKKNDGEWTSITSATGDSASTISVVSGDTVQFRGDNATYALSPSNYNSFSGTTCQFSLNGNIMSLLNSTGFAILDTLESANTFFGLFSNCTGLTDTSNLVLPATTLADACYCTMFNGCSSLTTAPDLPATTLAQNCYSGMFNECSSLTTAPELPATTLAAGCYNGMFGDCESLTTAPVLPATTLAEGCYESMFTECSNLNYIKCLATDISAPDCTYSWTDGVQTDSGTFVKASGMNDWTTDESGIPYGWTVVNA